MKTKPQNDEILVENVKDKGCNESYKEILHRHENLFYKICQKYMPIVLSKGLEKNDLLEDKHFVVFKSINSYLPNKNTKFSTWLGNCTRYHCLNFINSNGKYVSTEDEIIKSRIDSKVKESYADERDGVTNSEYIFNILYQLKDKRIAEVFRLRYFKDFGDQKKPTWSRIAKEINTSTQTAINLHHRGQKILKTKFVSKEYMPDKI
tara:strand:- start:13567 stop:14184 length:618 start_codon:yes stop_codon:yes gene_type:complete